MEKPTPNLAALPGLGPKSAALLARLGVGTPAQLQAHDPVALYLQLRSMEPGVSLNMLWGLVGARTGRRWQDVARDDKSELLARVAAAQEQTVQAGDGAQQPAPLTHLRNIGPTVARRLREVGITRREDLARVGAPRAYRLMAERAAPHRLAVCYYLYSLEGALQGRHWDDFSQEEKAALRRQTGLAL